MTWPVEPHEYQPPLFGQACGECGLDATARSHSIAPVDPRRLVRATDPVTSRKGAASVKYRATSQKALLAVAYLDGDLTDADAAKRAGLLERPGCCWWHRCSDLRHDGVIEPVGVARSALTGEEVMVCRLTDAGRKIVEGVRGE